MVDKSNNTLLKIVSCAMVVYGIATIIAVFIVGISTITGYDIHGGFDGMNLLFFPFVILLVIAVIIFVVCTAVFVIATGAVGLTQSIKPTPNKRIVLIVLASINLAVIHFPGGLTAMALMDNQLFSGVQLSISLALSILFLVSVITAKVT